MWVIRAKLLLGRFCCSDVEQCLTPPAAPWAALLPAPRDSDPPAQVLPGTFPQADPLPAPKDLLQAMAIDRDEAEVPCPSAAAAKEPGHPSLS